ncbi:MAG: hypothetical protein C0478_14235 [Planctomyces sp.]|nr:hypothetical protein [Planctomyces sp.]
MHGMTELTGIDRRIQELGLELPPAPQPGGVYAPIVIVDRLLYVSGQGPRQANGSLIVGRVGVDLVETEAYSAARAVGLTMLATIKQQLGTLNHIERLVKTLGMVNCVPEFTNHPQVINGFSTLMVEVFGEVAGKGARSAVGMGSLPSNIPVEVEAIFQLKS